MRERKWKSLTGCNKEFTGEDASVKVKAIDKRTYKYSSTIGPGGHFTAEAFNFTSHWHCNLRWAEMRERHTPTEWVSEWLSELVSEWVTWSSWGLPQRKGETGINVAGREGERNQMEERTKICGQLSERSARQMNSVEKERERWNCAKVAKGQSKWTWREKELFLPWYKCNNSPVLRAL